MQTSTVHMGDSTTTEEAERDLQYILERYAPVDPNLRRCDAGFTADRIVDAPGYHDHTEILRKKRNAFHSKLKRRRQKARCNRLRICFEQVSAENASLKRESTFLESQIALANQIARSYSTPFVSFPASGSRPQPTFCGTPQLGLSSYNWTNNAPIGKMAYTPSSFQSQSILRAALPAAQYVHVSLPACSAISVFHQTPLLEASSMPRASAHATRFNPSVYHRGAYSFGLQADTPRPDLAGTTPSTYHLVWPASSPLAPNLSPFFPCWQYQLSQFQPIPNSMAEEVSPFSPPTVRDSHGKTEVSRHQKARPPTASENAGQQKKQIDSSLAFS